MTAETPAPVTGHIRRSTWKQRLPATGRPSASAKTCLEESCLPKCLRTFNATGSRAVCQPHTVPATPWSAGGRPSTWVDWIFHLRGELFLPPQARGRERGRAAVITVGPSAVHVSGLWGPLHPQLPGHAGPCGRSTCSEGGEPEGFTAEVTEGQHSHSQPFLGRSAQMRPPGEIKRSS